MSLFTDYPKFQSDDSDKAAPSKKGNGTYDADEAYKKVYTRTRDHKAAVRAYCGENKWAIENAKATGNW